MKANPSADRMQESMDGLAEAMEKMRDEAE
jgi:hypothetical protein